MVAAAFIVWAIAVTLWDLKFQRIPNVLILAALVPSVAAVAVSGNGLLGQALPSSIAGMGLALLVTLPGYFHRALGGGDVKCAACMGWILGWPDSLTWLVLSGLLLGLSAVGLLIFRRVSGTGERSQRFAAGPAFAGAFVAVVVLGALMVRSS